MFDVFNGHPLVHNAGDAAHGGTEVMWDHLLELGRRVYGLASDDAHHNQTHGPLYANLAGAGCEWAQAPSASQRLFEALEAGRIYASTGVELAELEVGNRELRVCVDSQPGEHYTIEFVGLGGQVVEVEEGAQARYRVGGAQPYVPARLTSSAGTQAWLQPHFIVH